MQKNYAVMFYGEIQLNKNLGQVRELLAKIVCKDGADINYLFSGNQILLKRCLSYEHARKYADLFEKAGAKVNIEQIDVLYKSDVIHEQKSEDTSLEQIKNIDNAIAQIEKQIRETEAEDQKYAGGLIKALIGSRLAILKQTHAMLQQRAQANLFRISIQYVVDGKAFLPPEDAAVKLGMAERELAELSEKITSTEADAARYSGGLVQALSLSTVAQLKQTQAMLEQKCLALKFSLPQYIGFKGDPVPILPVSTSINNTEEDATPKEKQWHIVGVDSKVTESNTSWWRYAWRLTLANDSQKPMVFSATIEFQDTDGFVIDQGYENGLVVSPGTEQTFTGYKLVSVPGALKVQKTLAKISVR